MNQGALERLENRGILLYRLLVCSFVGLVHDSPSESGAPQVGSRSGVAGTGVCVLVCSQLFEAGLEFVGCKFCRVISRLVGPAICLQLCM